MRAVYVSLIFAIGLAGSAQAQEAAATSAPAQPPAVAPPTPAAPASADQPAAPPSQAAPEAQPAAPAPAPAEPPPSLPTSGDGAVVLSVLEKVCVPLVRGGNLDQLAPSVGMKKNRRDGTWSLGLGGARDYTITVLPQGVNKDVCQAEVHFAVGQDEPIVKALNIWAFLHQPELVLQANYVNLDADGIKRVRKSWEHLEEHASIAANFTIERKPDGSPLNRKYDTGMLFYQERKF